MSEPNKRIEAKSKPQKCPACGASPVAVIQYGLPAFSPQLKKGMEEGTIVLGGCCITGDDPFWQCPNCHLRIYKSGEGK